MLNTSRCSLGLFAVPKFPQLLSQGLDTKHPGCSPCVSPVLQTRHNIDPSAGNIHLHLFTEVSQRLSKFKLIEQESHFQVAYWATGKALRHPQVMSEGDRWEQRWAVCQTALGILYPPSWRVSLIPLAWHSENKWPVVSWASFKPL